MISRLKQSLAWRYWAKKYAHSPVFDDYKTRRDKATLRQEVSGPMADLFFAQSHEPVWKWMHYLPIYDKIFGDLRGTPVRFLEIGVFRGGSMRLWREWFGADAVIFGVDIDPECAKFDGIAGNVRIGSQADPEFLARVVEEMGGVDVVLDDGSHFARHQQISFETLFPLLADGGRYVIEDMHTAYWPSFEGGLGRPGTAVEFLKAEIDTMHRHYVEPGRNSAEAIAPIESIQFFDSIAMVTKRRQAMREAVMVP